MKWEGETEKGEKEQRINFCCPFKACSNFLAHLCVKKFFIVSWML